MGAADAIGPDQIDGRKLRSQRSRLAVIEAILACYEDGIVRPSVAEIARRSGVSERSVFRHFDDLEELATSAITHQASQLLGYFADPPRDGTLRQRVDALVDQRLRLFDRLRNLARAAAHHAARSTAIADAVRDRRNLLRAQIERQFAPELDGLDRRTRALLVAQIEQALSIEALDYLRDPTGAGLGPRDLRAALVGTVDALLAAAPIDPAGADGATSGATAGRRSTSPAPDTDQEPR